jgi:hypothetical protein
VKKLLVCLQTTNLHGYPFSCHGGQAQWLGHRPVATGRQGLLRLTWLVEM